MTVAYQGLPGAFSHEACREFLPGEEAIGLPTFADVVRAVNSGEADLGVLPIENNNVGVVTEVSQLLEGSSLKIVAEHRMPIRIHLLGLPQSSAHQLRTAVSHPMALKQCERTLEKLGLGSEAAPSTSDAAKSLADPSKAALASEAAAEAYGLVVLKRNVHDREHNETTFIVVGRQK